MQVPVRDVGRLATVLTLPPRSRGWHNLADMEPARVQRTESTFATTGGLQLFGRTWRPESPPRATLVLVHGYAEHSGRYEYAGSSLAERGYAVCALDLRGHGRSA